jgi:hypothetical protein
MGDSTLVLVFPLASHTPLTRPPKANRGHSMPARRRGLGELLAAIIVALAVTSLAVVFAETANRTAGVVRVAGKTVEEGLVDASYPPSMSVGLNGTSLYLVVYPQKPLKVKYIVYVKDGKVLIENESITILNTTQIVVDPSYDCRPASIMLVTDSGIVIPYSPSRDPNVLRAAYAGRWDLLKKTSIDCSLLKAVLEETASEKSAGEGGSSGDYILSDTVYKVLDASPAVPSYEAGNPYAVTILKVHVNGSISENSVNLDYNVSIANGSQVGVTRIQLLASSSLYQPATTASYIGTITGDQGQPIGLYAVASCTQEICVAGILYASSEPTIYYGEGYINMTAFKHSSSGSCNIGRNSYIAPALLGQVSNYKASLNATCTQNALGVDVSFSGEIVDGYYATTGPLVLVTATYGGSLDLDAWVWLAGTRVLKGNASEARLPFNGPIEYWLVKLDFEAGDPLAQVVGALYNYTPPNPILKVETGNATLYREVTTLKSVMPLSNVAYYLITPPYQAIPFSTSLSIRYTSHVRQDTSYVKIIDYKWNLSGAYTPSAFMAPIPYIVVVKCLDSGEEYVIAAPPGPTIEVSQASSSYRGLAILLGGLQATLTVENSNASLAYVIAVSGDIDTGLTIAYSIYNAASPEAIVLSNGRAEITLERGLYIITAAPSNPSLDPSNYQAAYARVY